MGFNLGVQLIKEEFMTKKFLTVALFSLLSTSAMSDDIYLGEPGYGGTGCPAGSASVTLSPDLKSLSILFDEFIVEAGGESGKSLARKSCNVAIPVHVPSGMTVSVLKVDYRGFLSLPRGAESRFSAEYFFAGSRGPKIEKTFRGAKEDDFTVTNDLDLISLVWSPCGKDVNLRINTSLLLKTNRFLDEALSSLDSADIKAGMIYHLSWKRCL
jgi:Domain of unknown function (DUF4360)